MAFPISLEPVSAAHEADLTRILDDPRYRERWIRPAEALHLWTIPILWRIRHFRAFAVVADGSVAGWGELRIWPKRHHATFSLGLAAEFAEHGIGTAAGTLLRDYAFEALPLMTFGARHRDDPAYARVLEKVGFRVDPNPGRLSEYQTTFTHVVLDRKHWATLQQPSSWSIARRA